MRPLLSRFAARAGRLRRFGCACAAAAAIPCGAAQAEGPAPGPVPPLVAAPAFRQIVPQPGPGDPGEVLILVDRERLGAWKTVREMLQRTPPQTAEGLPLLQKLLDLPEDGFFHPDPTDRSTYRSLKGEILRTLGELPQEVRAAYELQFGTTARTDLDRAAKADDVTGIEDVSRRFGRTQAGRDALARLGAYHLDHGRPLAAALCFERLRREAAVGAARTTAGLRAALAWHRAGHAERAAALVAELRSLPAPSVPVSCPTVPLPAADDGVGDWLEQHFGKPLSGTGTRGDAWPQVRGNAARNAVVASVAALPADAAPEPWTASLAFEPDDLKDLADRSETEAAGKLRDIVRQLDDSVRKGSGSILPRGAAVATGETVVVRTWGSLRAFDLSTGRLRWESLGDSVFGTIFGTAEGSAPVPNSAQIATMLAGQRLFADANWGGLATDGRRVFCVEEQWHGSRGEAGGTPTTVLPKPHDRLASYDVRTGRTVWHVGGAPGDPVLVLPLAGTFFLGAPLCLGGRLFCLTDVAGEVRLVVLDAATGRTDWMQPLAAPRTSIEHDRRRRTAGSTPSYADGILVCPTDAGAVVALDLSQRSLLWGYRPGAAAGPGPGPVPPPFPFPPRPQPPPQPNADPGWLDSIVVLAEGRAFVATPGTNELACLDLLDGRVRWKSPRGDGLYVAGATEGRVLVVGRGATTALKTENGAVAWEKPLATDAPSGRGFVRGDELLLPTAAGEILRIDAAQGTIRGRAKLPGQPVPGNLCGAPGRLVSQGAETVVVVPWPLPEAK